MKKSKLAYLIMIAVNLVWGLGYIACEIAFNNGWGVFTFLFYKNLIGFIFCFIVAIKTKFWKDKNTLIVGAFSGLIYFLGYAFQLTGQTQSTVTNTALITALGIIMGPLFYWLFFKKKPEWYAFVACGVGLFGSFMLSYQPGLKMNRGDLLLFIASIIYAIHLTYVGKRGDKTILFGMLATQFLVMTLFSGGAMIIKKEPIFGDIKAFPWVLYSGLVCGCLGITGQFYSQRNLASYKVSLLLALEGLFGTLFAIILNNEIPTPLVIGGALIITLSITFMGYMDRVKHKKLALKGEIAK